MYRACETVSHGDAAAAAEGRSISIMLRKKAKESNEILSDATADTLRDSLSEDKTVSYAENASQEASKAKPTLSEQALTDEKAQKRPKEICYSLTKSHFPSADGKNDIAYYVFRPLQQEPKAIVQISHGMCEYLLRYEDFANELCRHGYVVCGNDHLGHGYTAKTPEDLGFTAEGGGGAFFVQDVHTLTKWIKQQYPTLPLILLGHSMGSFIARLYLAHYSDEVDAAVIVGTGGPEAPSGLARKLAQILIVKKGERYRSKQLDRMAFGSYNKKFKKEHDSYSWLTRDTAIRDRYAQDPFCTYIFTTRAFYDLFDLLHAVSKKSWAGKIRKDLPMLLMSGDMDPVGNYGKGVEKVFHRLADAGIEDVTLRLYKNGRHEILNELGRETIFDQTIEWMDSHLPSTESTAHESGDAEPSGPKSTENGK